MTTTTTTVDVETVETLCESWREITPTLTEASLRTGLSRPEALLLFFGAMLASLDVVDHTEPWESA